MTMRTPILVFLITAAAMIAGPWTVNAAPTSPTAPISTPITTPITTDGNSGSNQDHVVGEDMC